MSYPPPPGLSSSSNLPASLPARPPPSAVGQGPPKPPTSNGGFKPAFTAFAPRSVAQTNSYRTNSPAQYSAAPSTSYSATPQYPPQYPPQDQNPYQTQQDYSAAPQIRNPFVPTANNSSSNPYAAPANYDPEYEAQIAQWQSAYASKDGERARPPGVAATAAAVPTTRIDSPHNKDAAPKTVQRTGGGTTWTDSSLLEWDPAHFRIFVGNLAGEVTDDSLLKAFSKYPSVQKARVIREKRTTKSKGYGFVSFSDGDDYFLAAREMQGKYIGSHPVLLKRSTTEVRPTTVKDQKKKKGKGGGGNEKVEHGGIEKNKKGEKTKGGLKLLG